MRRATLWIPLLIAGLTFALWALLNRPTEEPPWPAQIQGFSFAPMRAYDDPTEGNYPSILDIDADLALLQGDVHAVRTYEVRDTIGEVPRLAAAHGLNVTIGAWLDTDTEGNAEEIERLLEILREGHRNIVRVMVGNEVLLRDDMTVAELMDTLDLVRKNTYLPVSTAEPPYIWLKYPKLAEHVDFITIHLLPYWDGVEVEKAVDFAFKWLDEIRKTFPDKPIVIGEVGWPSNGRRNGGAEPSLANQSRFLRRFIARAEEEHLVYYIMEAFDQPWKAKVEGPIGTYWGVYNADREPKFAFTQPIVRVPDWKELSALSIVTAVLLLVFLYRDSSTLGTSGKGFLALVTYGISTAAVWIIYDYTRQYMTPATAVVGLVLLIGGLGVITLLMAEAHEWAESLWLKRWRRPFPRRKVPDAELPFVSVHVPAYNEPPELMIETLDALAALDYPSFEVIVMDNNTKDPEVWGPVRAHCEALGGRFRFFHANPLPGFKAGALNFALRETDPRAEVVAVIDADYLVDRRWLRDLVVAFADPEVGIVQAPQDYRDGAQNAFKAMCLAEYRGFFHLGMVTRNERNAIIQHGTMTMIRRPTLDGVGGWAEWCITEDAELGLRLFERGDKALYLPCTYGKGLMPDTFNDFKKQRFRWAYGAVRILKAHRRELLGLQAHHPVSRPAISLRGRLAALVRRWVQPVLQPRRTLLVGGDGRLAPRVHAALHQHRPAAAGPVHLQDDQDLLPLPQAGHRVLASKPGGGTRGARAIAHHLHGDLERALHGQARVLPHPQARQGTGPDPRPHGRPGGGPAGHRLPARRDPGDAARGRRPARPADLDRRALGAVHPLLVGGHRLPDQRPPGSPRQPRRTHGRDALRRAAPSGHGRHRAGDARDRRRLGFTPHRVFPRIPAIPDIPDRRGTATSIADDEVRPK